MNCIIYCRVSSREQAEGTSLEFQEEACREYANTHRISITKIFIERGESAKFAERTQLLELIDFCRTCKGQVQALVVWKVDRFARNVADHFNIKATLLKYGVRIVSVTEPIDANPEGKLMETILAGFAQFDNDIRAVRTVQGMRRKIEEGIFPWQPPLGYRSVRQNREKKTQPDVPDQPLFGLLQKAWREFASGAHTKAEILQHLTGWGVTTHKGRPLTPQFIDALFCNPYYQGVLVDPWSSAEHEGRHVPMVTRSEFARVQQVLRGRNRSKAHVREREEFPLRGCARCPSCKGYVTAAFSRGRSKQYPYYMCWRQCGRQTSYPAETVHAEFEAFLDQIAPKPEILSRLGEHIARDLEERSKSEKVKAARCEAELKRVKRALQELISMRAQHLITTDEFLEQKKPLAERRIALEAALPPPVQAQRGLHEQLDEIAAPLSRLRETWSELPLQFRPRFKQIVLPSGFVIGRIRTAEIASIFSLSGAFGGGNSNGVAPSLVSSNQIREEVRALLKLFEDLKESKQAVQKYPAGVTP